MAAFHPSYCWHACNGYRILGTAEVLIEVALPLPRPVVVMAFAVYIAVTA